MTIRTACQEALHEVTGLRDMARLQAHLFSIDARALWREFESQLDAARAEALKEGHEEAEIALSKLTKAAKLGQELLDQRRDGSQELDEPATKIMTRHPKTCGPRDSLSHAAQLMWDADCGSIPVVGKGEILMGMITDRDLAMAAYTQGKALQQMEVQQAMAHDVVAASDHSTIGELLGVMSTHQLRRLPVVDGQGRLLGIVALADVAHHVALSEEADAARSVVRTLTAISSS
jgi:CBS domain-containing protein